MQEDGTGLLHAVVAAQRYILAADVVCCVGCVELVS